MVVMERNTGTDARLDELSKRVDSIDRRMESGFAEVREEFRAVRTELSRLTYGLIGTVLVGFLGTITAIVTQT
jgi:hypothetical protein